MALVDATPGERLVAWLRARVLAVDCAVAVGLAVACAVFGLVTRAGAGYLTLSLLLLAALALRRVRPEVCLVAVAAVMLLQWLTVGGSSGALPADVAVPIAIHAAAAYGRAWAGWAGLAVALVEAVLAGVMLPLLPSPAWAHLLVGAFFASSGLAAWAIGSLQCVRRRQVDALAERARLLEIERDQQARLAVLGERTRIAREIHDVVGHSLAVVIAQADGGRYAATAEAAAAALAAIGEHARRALSETRRALGVLRDGDESAGRPEGFEAHQAGVDDLPGLVERIRVGGLAVDLTLDLPPASLEPGLSLVAYRIVQEGLTNVMKHAGSDACAEVAVRWSRRLLEIDVLDNGRGPAYASSGAGYGLAGMRERVCAFGGTVTLAARPGGGAALRARIPVPR
ncbi:sensor histidine kinase [Dactylosporangium sp. CA-233914]|uniref:sensor histidine kinase n=1 Tax=Dactylosporangium sp. CA-233914 TaxID=3239934 RepID=UPI003D8A169C